MEKMFVYPEAVESAVCGMTLESLENLLSTSDIVSYRCKLYRTRLDQQTASQFFRLAPLAQREQADCAYA